MSLRVATLLSATLMCACATVHQGDVGEKVGGEKVEGLELSAQQMNDHEKEPFCLSTVTFENTSDKWIRITQVEPLIGKDMAAKISVVVGDDLKDWATARADREQMNRHNKEIAQAALVGVGTAAAIAGGASGNSGVAVGGLMVMSGTYGWVLSDVISASYHKATNPKWLPENHVQTPFGVPGKGFVRKWILFNVPTGVRLSEIPFKILTADGHETVINVKVAR